jgi:hypothetical protein
VSYVCRPQKQTTKSRLKIWEENGNDSLSVLTSRSNENVCTQIKVFKMRLTNVFFSL